MKIDLSKLTDEQLVNTLIELDKVRLSTSKKMVVDLYLFIKNRKRGG